MLIKLEKFNDNDIQKLVSWTPNKEFLLQWAGPSYSLDTLEEQLLNEIKAMEDENPKNLMFSVKLIETNETIGHMQLLAIDRSNKSAKIGRVLIGDRSQRNKGIGLEMINNILEIAFDELHLHRVELGVFDFNKSAIACYEKAGFIIEGKLRDSRKIGDEYWSLINMSILEDEYRSLRKHITNEGVIK